MSFTTRALAPETWPAFAALAERHNGVWGGCWCMAFHAKGAGRGADEAPDHRAEKERLVARGETHSAVVFEGERAVGWCQYGTPAELPRIKGRKVYLEGNPKPADWRITCFFVDTSTRGQGVAAAALAGALELIGEAGGGRVEGFPEDTAGRKATSSFLFSGTLAMFEAAGFARERKIGKHRWLVSRTVA